MAVLWPSSVIEVLVAPQNFFHCFFSIYCCRCFPFFRSPRAVFIRGIALLHFSSLAPERPNADIYSDIHESLVSTC